jgi:hypothetical protein
MLEMRLSNEPAPCWRTASGLKLVAKGMMYVRYDCSRKVSGMWAVSPASFGSARAIVLAGGSCREVLKREPTLRSGLKSTTVRRVQWFIKEPLEGPHWIALPVPA